MDFIAEIEEQTGRKCEVHQQFKNPYSMNNSLNKIRK